MESFSSPLGFIPQITFLLWFLYYLILITIVAFVLAQILKKKPILSVTISRIFNGIMKKHVFRLTIFAGLIFVLYLSINTSEIDTSTSFIPEIKTFSFYFFFYLIGWILFKSKHLLESFKRFDWLSLIVGVILFFVYILTSQTSNDQIVMLYKSFIVWLFIIDLFVRFGTKHSAKMRYISDASYWVYLIHLPLTMIIPGLIYHWNVPTPFKCLTVMTLTGTICFLTYHYFVRSRFIGKFLNGKEYRKNTL